MKKKKERLDLGGDSGVLMHSPFAALDGRQADLPKNAAEAASAAPPPVEILPPAFAVARTRKGGWPLALEKRRGKLVTVVGNVSGDRKAALKAFRRLCAAGGAVREDTIELQGDHREKIEARIHEKRPPSPASHSRSSYALR